MHEEHLWENFHQTGSSKSFKALFDAFYTPLCRYAFCILNDEMDAEEIVLDLFIYLWKNNRKIEIQASFNAYLFKSIRNRAYNRIRSRHAGKEQIDDYKEILKVPDSLSDMELHDIEMIVEDAVNTLPPKCKETYLKSRKDNLRNEEIASDMGVSRKTVEAQMTKAMKRIRLNMKKLYIFILFI